MPAADSGWPSEILTGTPELDQLIPLVYQELRVIAHRELPDDPDRTLSTTALVHEAYLKLSRDGRVTTRGRGYFFAAASLAMRRIVVDYARRKRRLKRGGAIRLVPPNDVAGDSDHAGIDVLDLEQGLIELAAIAPRAAQVVECRFFGGLGVANTALALGVTDRTVKRDWAFARAWLFDRLRQRAADP